MHDNISFIEALAHQMRGATIMFFLILCVLTFGKRKQNRMMRVLFISFVCMAVGLLKDSIFLFGSMADNSLVNAVVELLDLSVMLVVVNFFLEAVKPESTGKPFVWISPVLVLAFIPVYSIIGKAWIVTTAYILAYSVTVAKFIFIIISALRHRQFLEEHYSYSDNIDVRWVVVSCIAYSIMVFAYSVFFKETTWLSEVLYCTSTIVVCSYMILSALGHKIIICTAEEDTTAPECSSEASLTESFGDSMEDRSAVDPSPNNLQYITSLIEPKLKQSMETDKLYLNPQLSLNLVATEIGSNTKYLSIYLNRRLGCTFNNYINRFRVEEACSILRNMTDAERLNMTQVAQMSGFNSVSSFNRYFRSVKGGTPKDYYKNCKQ
ncbi:MAG: helix-turn-helix domain-containing protein [Bacteroidales bacterium]|nr:helix-turn-helix domain-containing protein [Bacteroidales bacterium]